MSRTFDVETERAMIIDALTESYGGPAWHGPSVLEALAGVDAHTAARKLDTSRNSIHELVLHLAHGRHLLTERVNHAPSAAFPRVLREPWWPAISDDTSQESWQADVKLLDDCHAMLLDAIRRASAEQLARVPDSSAGYSISRQLIGMALHDTYHAGQIRLLALAFAASSPTR